MTVLGVVALIAGWTLGCASLRPFADVLRAEPPDRFVRVGGQRVYVEQAGVSGETVVLLHGFGASSYSWRRVIPELAKSFRVVAIDLNGFGYTERPRDAASYTREGQERLILGVLDALGIRRAHFIGHSYGGGLTLFLSARHPERMLSMVLVDSSAPTYPDDRRSRMARIRPLNAVFLEYALRVAFVRRSLAHSFYDPSVATPELARAYLARLQVEGERDAYYGLTARLGPPGAGVDLTRIEVPALIVWGANDPLIQPALGREAARLLPHAQFSLIEKTGHVPIEERPLEWLRIVLPFLAHGSTDSALPAGHRSRL